MKNKKEVSEKLQKEWDKELPKVPMLKVIRLNAKEWWIILFGVLASMCNGAVMVLFSVIFGEVLSIFSRPYNEVLSGIHLYAGLFILLGVGLGITHFLKV